MTTLVITALGNDQTGLVDRLSGVIADHRASWDTSHMSHLAGKFAGIVLVSVSDANAEALIADLDAIETEGLLDLTIERVDSAATNFVTDASSVLLDLELFGQDHPGIIHDVSHALASEGVSIHELTTETTEAPMAGGTIFKAKALLRAPATVDVVALHDALEALAHDLMVELQVALD